MINKTYFCCKIDLTVRSILIHHIIHRTITEASVKRKQDNRLNLLLCKLKDNLLADPVELLVLSHFS